MPTYTLKFCRRVGLRSWEIPIGRIHGHRRLGFDAATPTNGHSPVTIDDYWHAQTHCNALNLNLRDASLTGKVFAIWTPRTQTLFKP
jgi:hypothetical protein